MLGITGSSSDINNSRDVSKCLSSSCKPYSLLTVAVSGIGLIALGLLTAGVSFGKTESSNPYIFWVGACEFVIGVVCLASSSSIYYMIRSAKNAKNQSTGTAIIYEA